MVEREHYLIRRGALYSEFIIMVVHTEKVVADLIAKTKQDPSRVAILLEGGAWLMNPQNLGKWLICDRKRHPQSYKSLVITPYERINGVNTYKIRAYNETPHQLDVVADCYIYAEECERDHEGD